MSPQPTLHIRQSPVGKGKHAIRLTLRRPGQPDLEGEATIKFSLTEQEQEDLRWYMEDYLQRAEAVEPVTVEQVEALLRARGEELYRLVLAANLDTQAIWFAVRQQLADLRVEIAASIADAAAIPWELMRDPQSDSPIALRVRAFVRVQSNPSLGFVSVPPAGDGRLRLLYVASRPGGTGDVALRAVANRLLQDLGGDRTRFEIKALRPPTYEQLQKTLTDAKNAGKPFHIVHFDGHGMYADLSQTTLADWLKTISLLTLGGPRSGKHGYLLFEHPSRDTMRPVPGDALGKLLHDTGVPVLVLNACQSAMHDATAPAAPRSAAALNVHDEVLAIGSLAQAVIDQGIPAVLGMRYSVFVVTAAQYIGQLYAALAKGRPFGEAASQGRKHLAANPERWVGLEPRPLQDWFVPVVYEAAPMPLLSPATAAGAGLALDQPELDPVQTNQALRRYVPDTGFIGRDETLLLLDRAFDAHPVVLLHAYAGQGKTATAVEFARWYAMTGGLGLQPLVLWTSFEQPIDLNDVLNQIGQQAIPDWSAINELDKKRLRIVRLLRQFPVLWIWDNVELVAGFPAGMESQWTTEEQAELADFLKQIKLDGATQAKILLTSRRDETAWLGGIPRRIAMPRMSAADAAALAVQIGAERGLDRRQVGQWGPLLDYCAGNPLTLRVVAGQAVRQGLRSEGQIAAFIQAVRDGEQQIQDADAREGRDKSLGASLDYGFRHAFGQDELPIVALLHLFQGTVHVAALAMMGAGDYALPELAGKTPEQLTALLDRATEVGLLTQLTDHSSLFTGYYTIHPALPWYLRQLFDEHYPLTPTLSPQGRGGQSEARGQTLPSPSEGEGLGVRVTPLRAWVEAMGELSNYYTEQFVGGNRDVIRPLALEEANLLHARRAARRHGWWGPVISAMQGLKQLYQYQGRTAEWARLAAEIAHEYCTPDDGPIPGREDGYSVVMGYRVDLARLVDRDLPAAAALQEKRVAWDRQQAAPALALPLVASLDADQHNRIRTLGVSVFTLGMILMEQGSPDCVAAYEETIPYMQRIGDSAAEAIAQLNLGLAYKNLPAIRDLDAAQGAYQRSIALRDTKDALGRSKCLQAIGMVHHERFREARQRGEPAAVVIQHAVAAEQHYRQALALCPPSAVADLGPMHAQTGVLYADVGQIEPAREHYERAAQYFEQAGNRYDAGRVRYMIALMYRDAAEREAAPARRRDLLRRAAAYALASLSDFQHYQGRAAADEAKAQGLIDEIARALG
ncbi:MAG TPA: CHAT domain-containing protein [Anaerolineae bacterium]|nr:CHAT domain-containing protein [Anaerolineae bacterium]